MDQSLSPETFEFFARYLLAGYVVGETGGWEEPDPGRSAWLTLRDVRSIEFLDEVKSDG